MAVKRLLSLVLLAAMIGPQTVFAEPPQVPRVGFDEAAGDPDAMTVALRGADSWLKNVPILLRMPVRALATRADEDDRAREARLAALPPNVRLWLDVTDVPSTTEAGAVAAWRARVRLLVDAVRGRLAVVAIDARSAKAADAAYFLRVAAVQVRAVDPDVLVAIAPAGTPSAVLDRLTAVYAHEAAPYVDIVALPGGATIEVAEGVRHLLDRVDPSARIARVGVELGAGDDAARQRVVGSQLESLGSAVAINTYAATASQLGPALRAMRPLADILSGEVVSLDPAAANLSVERSGAPADGVATRLLYNTTTFATYLIYSAPGAAPLDVTLRLTSPGEVRVRRPLEDAVDPPIETAHDEGTQRVHARVPATAQPAILDFNYGAAATYALRDEATGRAQLTVEEIVARYQQVQTAQDDLLETYVADARMEQHFRPSSADAGYDVVSDTRIYRDREGIEWDERSFYVNGTKWGPDRPPFPLLQPEKVLSLPLDLRLTADYRYRLNGVERVDGRPCYAVAFEPHDASRSLYRGTIWIDAERFTRARLQTVQTRLSSPVVSSEETQRFEAISGAGGRTFWLPARIDTKQLMLIAGRNLLVEKAVTFGGYRINPADFRDARQEARASDRIMYRETDRGLRYFVKEHGNRVVSDRPTSSAKAVAMGVTVDPSYDFPLPIFGINYLDFDFHGKDNQLALLFAGVLALGNVQHSHVFGTPLDASADFFAIGVPSNDRVYGATGERPAERLLTWPLTFGANVGWQATSFQKFTGNYQFRFDGYIADRTTDPHYVTPRSTVTNGVGLGYEWRRSGYSIVLNGTAYRRVGWEPWGLPGALETPRPSYAKYSASVSKDLFWNGFNKVHLNAAWFGGHDLDRFTQYQFGLFDDTRLHGVPASGIRFGELGMVRGSYSFNVLDQYRFDLFLEHAVGRQEPGDPLRHITGFGTAFTLRTPWSTMLRTDIGKSLLPDAFKGTGSFVLQVMLLKPL